MNENEREIIVDSICALKQKKDHTYISNASFKQCKIDSMLLNHFISSNFSNTLNLSKYKLVGQISRNNNFSYTRSENKITLEFPNTNTIEGGLKKINLYADLMQDILKNASKSPKSGVIPLYYEKKFLLEHQNNITSNILFWFNLSLKEEAENLCKNHPLDKKLLKRLYAILLMLEYQNENFIDKDMIFSKDDINNVLESKGYILTNKAIDIVRK